MRKVSLEFLALVYSCEHDPVESQTKDADKVEHTGAVSLSEPVLLQPESITVRSRKRGQVVYLGVGGADGHEVSVTGLQDKEVSRKPHGIFNDMSSRLRDSVVRKHVVEGVRSGPVAHRPDGVFVNGSPQPC